MGKRERVSRGPGQVPGASSGAADQAAQKSIKPAPLEKSIVAGILKWLNAQEGCYAIKTQGGRNQSGQPDIIGSWRGRFFAFEVKRPGGKPTQLQLATLNKWRGAWGIVGVVHSVDEVKELLGVT